MLSYLASRPADACTVSEIANVLSLPRATCDTLLLALTDRGFVRRDRDRRYTLGGTCIALGDAARVANPSLRSAAIAAERLAHSLGAFVAVSIRDATQTRVVQAFDHGPPLGLRARLGEAITLAPPFGATFIAWDDEEAVQHWLDRADPPLSSHERATYRTTLRRVHQRGFSVMAVVEGRSTLIDVRAPQAKTKNATKRRDEAVHDFHQIGEMAAPSRIWVAQVSAPVFGISEAVDATLLLLGPNRDLTEAQVSLLGQQVMQAAKAASSALPEAAP